MHHKTNRLIIGVAIVFSLLIIAIAIPFISTFTQESRLESKLRKEINKTTDVSIIRYTSNGKYSGRANVYIEIKNKGRANFDYSNDGVHSIYSMGNYETFWTCYTGKPNEARVSIRGVTALNLNNGSQYHKWFPFEIRTIQDLVNKYDDINKILSSFPTHPDPDYVVTELHSITGKIDYSCDLFLSG